MAAPDFMPIYWPAYMAKTQHLSLVEHGAYLLLIGACWQQGNRLPVLHAIANASVCQTDRPRSNGELNKSADETTAFLAQKGWAIDDKAIARILHTDVRSWKVIRPNILPFFSYTSDGFLCHKRVGEELARAYELLEKRRVAGLRGAEGRYGKGYASAMANASQPHASNTYNLKETSKEKLANAYTHPMPQKPIDPTIDPEAGQLMTPDRWKTRLQVGRDRLAWPAKWGPMPNQPGCVVPAGLVTTADGRGWRDWDDDLEIKRMVGAVRV